MQRSLFALALLSVVAVAPGCRVNSESYERCFDSTDCANAGEGCFSVTNGSNTTEVCSISCSSSASCPYDDYGRQGTCITAGICLQSCSSDFDCYGSLICDGGVCLPNPGGPVGGFVDNYRSCTASSDCRDPSLECVTFDAGGAAFQAVCSRTGCASDSDCPIDARGGRGACLRFGGGPSACWERCEFRGDCPDTFNWDCTTSVNGNPVPLPGVCAPR